MEANLIALDWDIFSRFASINIPIIIAKNAKTEIVKSKFRKPISS